MKICGRWLIVYPILLMSLIQGVYGIQITASGDGDGESGTVTMNFDTLKTTAMSAQMEISGATVTPSVTITGPVKKFEQTHAVKDRTGKSASVYAKVLNAPGGLTYISQVLPKEGTVGAQPWISAEQWLTVPKADSIKCTAAASYGKLSADVSVEEMKGKSSGDYATLIGYDGKAYASATQVEASQTATSGSGDSINIYGHARDTSGSYSIDTPITGIACLAASFKGLDALSSAGATTKVIQSEHVIGRFSSKSEAGRNTKTRTSNFGTEYDLNMQAIKGSLPTGTLGYYVNPRQATAKLGAIQGAVNAAQPGDTINAAAGTYREDANINKVLTLKGLGDPTASSFTLNAILGKGSGGITAPVVNVNPAARIQDGVTLVSSGGTVNVAAGTYKENVQIDKSLNVKGAGSSSTIVDGTQAGSVFTIGVNNPTTDVTLSKMTVTNGNAYDGGGIWNNDGKLTLTGILLAGNNANNNGGGIYNTGTVSFIDSSITGNIAGNGGGIYNDPKGALTVKGGQIFSNDAFGYGGGVFNEGVATMSDSQIYSNNVYSYDGGGISNYGGNLVVDGCNFYQNTAYGYGGGIDNWGGTLAVTNSRIFENTAEGAGGISNSAAMKLVASEVFKNVANWEGGGIVNYDDGVNLIQADLIDSAVVDNTAWAYGGGISNNGVSGTAIVNLDNSQISGNSIGSPGGLGFGGGIYNLATTLNLNGGLITKNSANYGGGIYNEADGVVNLNSGLIGQNTAFASTPSGGGIYNLGTVGGTGDPVAIVQGNSPDQIAP